ncbi:hypothetical protein C7M84_019019 [Penaeus vannamei]|uniref:Uncharacterized protein n=1 Tax=Penaeus vannamei TaxID=6689 RepID=A0A423SFV8_PENVA|nr:hypothetical protein C7M84_019019 [Penaeus vannamei]
MREAACAQSWHSDGPHARQAVQNELNRLMSAVFLLIIPVDVRRVVLACVACVIRALVVLRETLGSRTCSPAPTAARSGRAPVPGGLTRYSPFCLLPLFPPCLALPPPLLLPNSRLPFPPFPSSLPASPFLLPCSFLTPGSVSLPSLFPFSSLSPLASTLFSLLSFHPHSLEDFLSNPPFSPSFSPPLPSYPLLSSFPPSPCLLSLPSSFLFASPPLPVLSLHSPLPPPVGGQKEVFALKRPHYHDPCHAHRPFAALRALQRGAIALCNNTSQRRSRTHASSWSARGHRRSRVQSKTPCVRPHCCSLPPAARATRPYRSQRTSAAPASFHTHKNTLARVVSGPSDSCHAGIRIVDDGRSTAYLLMLTETTVRGGAG